MATAKILKMKKWDAYSDILYGIVCWIFYAGIVASMVGVSIPVLPVPQVLTVSQEVLSSTAPTLGDWILILLVVSYGAIWGTRMIMNAHTKIREINEELANN